jgi:ferritin-like metal-binding protein YciE
MKVTNTTRDLFFDQLRDLHSMESQLCGSMPSLADLTHDGGLEEAIVAHAAETAEQRGAIEQIFARHGVEIGDDKCKAIAGLIEGGDAHLQSVGNHQIRDLMMIAHCMRIEHYEIAAYEITTDLASRLGMEDEAAMLGELLSQEKSMQNRLIEMQPYIFQTANTIA